MIKINYQGRYGNSLFQYGAASFLASKFNQRITNPLDSNIILFNNIGSDKDFSETIEVTDANFEEIFSKEKLEKNIFLNGFFQCPLVTKLFAANRNFFYSPEFANDGTYIHVRLGDLYMTHAKSGNRYQPLEYYRKAIGNTKGGFISSDSPEDPIVKELQKEFDLEFFTADEETTICFASSFNHKVLSLGTFSWWIGFLGNQKSVTCPDTNNHPIWHGEIFPQPNWKVVSDYI